MTLQEKILLIDQFIRKEPDTTIGEFYETVQEIESIERITSRKEREDQNNNNYHRLSIANKNKVLCPSTTNDVEE